MADKYVPIFYDWIEATKELKAQEKGRLIDAIVEYARGGDWSELLEGNERYLFPVFKMKVDEHLLKHPGIPSGEEHWNWKGGITPENQRGRSSAEYHAWRKAVFQRDNYTCVRCKKRGGKLNAHHILKWSDYPQLRYEVSNGITLCEQCHKVEHRGGKKCRTG